MADNVATLYPQAGTLEAEQALIGACLLAPNAFDVVCRLVRAADFSEPAHQAVWEAMERARDGGKTSLDRRIIIAALGEDANIDLGGLSVGAYIASLAANAVSIKEAPDFARIIREEADKRRVRAVAASINTAMRDPFADVESVVAESIGELDAIAQSAGRTSTPRVSLGDAAERALEESRLLATEKKRRGVSTGLEDLDRMILGLREGKMYVVAGRPGMGKTMLALQIALTAARRGVGVYFVSLEMDEAELSERALSCEVERLTGEKVPYQDLASFSHPRERDPDIEKAFLALKEFPLVIEQEPGLTMGQIRARARQTRVAMASAGVKLGLIITDHIGLVRATQHYRGNKVAETGEVSNGHKALAKDMAVPVVALCQLNREVETRDDKRPTLADLKWSGEIEQDADCIIFPFREAYYLNREKNPTHDQIMRLADCQNLMEIHVAKNRGGPEGRLEAFCLPSCNVVRDLERRR